MPTEVILPRVDMDMTTGKISRWLVEAGAAVTKGQPLFEIETDKATMEIDAEMSGTIRELTEVGSTSIAVGSVVAWIYGEGESTQATPTVTPAPTADRNAAAPAEPAAIPDAVAPPAPAPLPAGVAPASEPASAPPAEIASDLRPRATPLARRLARLGGVALAEQVGTGPRGRIQAVDITSPPVPLPAPSVNSTPAAQPIHASAAATGVAIGEIPSPDGLKRLRDGTGRPLFMVHGFGAEAGAWRPFLQGRLLDRPVLALDLPGHGKAPLGTLAGFDDLVEAVGVQVALAGAVDVVAHSLGAAIMTAVAARGLADIRSLVLLSPAGLGPEMNGPFIDGFVAATTEAAMTRWMGELVADPGHITPTFVRATLKSRAGTEQAAMQRRLADFLFPDGTQAISIRAELAALRIPTRIVFGTGDRIIPSRHASALPPLVALHVLPGIGHMPQLEAPDLVAAIINQTSRG